MFLNELNNKDLNPEETKEMILNLIAEIAVANSITIKLFNNNPAETLEYNFTANEIAVAKEFSMQVLSELPEPGNEKEFDKPTEEE